MERRWQSWLRGGRRRHETEMNTKLKYSKERVCPLILFFCEDEYSISLRIHLRGLRRWMIDQGNMCEYPTSHPILRLEVSAHASTTIKATPISGVKPYKRTSSSVAHNSLGLSPCSICAIAMTR
jgi:hypothetical protein